MTERGKHTPGPWIAIKAGRDWYIGPKAAEESIGGGHFSFAHVYEQTYHPTGDWEAEAEANARLVASAPDLLAALEQWQKFMHENYRPDEISWYHETDAAIAKARGEK